MHQYVDFVVLSSTVYIFPFRTYIFDIYLMSTNDNYISMPSLVESGKGPFAFKQPYTGKLLLYTCDQALR